MVRRSVTVAESVGVVGCGVIGLSTAVLAQAAGYRVTIYTDRAPTDTTSTKAAASFKPVDVAYTEATRRMLHLSWAEFERIVAEFPEVCGVRRHLHWDAASAPFAAPPYLDVMEEVEAVERPD